VVPVLRDVVVVLLAFDRPRGRKRDVATVAVQIDELSIVEAVRQFSCILHVTQTLAYPNPFAPRFAEGIVDGRHHTIEIAPVAACRDLVAVEHDTFPFDRIAFYEPARVVHEEAEGFGVA